MEYNYNELFLLQKMPKEAGTINKDGIKEISINEMNIAQLNHFEKTLTDTFNAMQDNEQKQIDFLKGYIEYLNDKKLTVKQIARTLNQKISKNDKRLFKQSIERLNLLLSKTEKTNTPQQETPIKELHNNIFKDNTFLIFKQYYNDHNLTGSSRTDLRLLFELLKKDCMLVNTIELKHYINWLNDNDYYNSDELKSINIKTNPNIKRTNDYDRIKDNLKITL